MSSFKSRKIKTLMNSNPVSVEADFPLADAAQIMVEKNIGSLIVTEKNIPVGMLTKRHFVQLFANKKNIDPTMTVGQVMAHPIISILPETSASKAMYLIEKHKIKRMPVIKNSRLVGVVSLRDLLTHSTHSLELLESETRVLQKEATQDPLTGLFNKRYFVKKMQEEYAAFLKTGNSSSLIFFDVDHFKDVNDNFSHLAGDYVLETIADLFRKNTRSVDVISRYGGEEIVLIDTSRHTSKAVSLAQKLRMSVEDFPFVFGSHKFKLTISAGVADFSSGKDYIDVINKADEAMYFSKREGRNKVSYYDGESHKIVLCPV